MGTNGIIAIDLETRMIKEGAILPLPIVLSYTTANVNKLLPANMIVDFMLQAEKRFQTFVGHNISFDLGIIYIHYPVLRSLIWKLYDEGRVFDTMLSAKLSDLATTGLGHSYSLKAVTAKYLGLELDKNEEVRTNYESVEHLPIGQWPTAFTEYALKDSRVTFDLYNYLYNHHDNISTRAAFAFQLCTYEGFYVDQELVASEKIRMEAAIFPLREFLVEQGYMSVTKQGSYKKELKKLRTLVEQLNTDAARSKKGSIKTGAKDIGEIDHPITAAFSSLAKYSKEYETYIPALEAAKPSIHPNFNTIVATGRSSSFASTLYPSCNIQNIPRDGHMRECFVARPGCVLVSIDYGMLELCSVAQQLINVFGKSNMADEINSGDAPVDLHSAMGVYLYNKDYNSNLSLPEFISRKHEPEIAHYRQLSKPINLGLPGGLGANTMILYAKALFNIDIDQPTAFYLRDTFFEKYPDLRFFLRNTSENYKTGNRMFSDKHNKYEDEYSYMINGRQRAKCSYTAFCNGFLMQSLSADGAKIAVYNVSKYLNNTGLGKLLAFIHDELIFEMPEAEYYENYTRDVSMVMIEAMQTQMPDVRIAVEASVMGKHWSKHRSIYSKVYWKNKHE